MGVAGPMQHFSLLMQGKESSKPDLILEAKLGNIHYCFVPLVWNLKTALNINLYLGVGEVIVVINKMDVVDWSKDRFDEIKNMMSIFLQKQVGFENVSFVPISGLSGVNLIEKVHSHHPLAQWYSGPTFIQKLGKVKQISWVNLSMYNNF